MSEGPCTFCGSAYVKTWQVSERRYGTNEIFHVGECAACPALILLDPPDDPGSYYPADYPSFSIQRPTWRRSLRRLRNRLLLGRHGPVARLVGRVRPHAATRFLDRTGTTPRTRVLDVGSGAGALLEDLALAGFTHLVGVDAYIPASIDGAGYRVVKGTLADVDEQFDLVMFHHSLEHMRDQRSALAAAARVLAPKGWCVIRVPVFPSAAWDTFHEHWFQLDMPRHEYIHSVNSLVRLAAESGLKFEGVEYDSTVHQFAGSEGYRRGLKLRATNSFFPRDQMRVWERQVKEINAAGRGDQAIFYFRGLASRP